MGFHQEEGYRSKFSWFWKQEERDVSCGLAAIVWQPGSYLEDEEEQFRILSRARVGGTAARASAYKGHSGKLSALKSFGFCHTHLAFDIL